MIESLADALKESINKNDVLNILKHSFILYLKKGPRSNEKVKFLHKSLSIIIETSLTHILQKNYSVKVEQNVKSGNSIGKKNCDIVVFFDEKVCAVLPVKFIMTNFLQNINNYSECLTGEIFHLHWNNPDLVIIPLNFVFNEIPYLDKEKVIKKFESVYYNKHFNYLQNLKTANLIKDSLTFILKVIHQVDINDNYNKRPYFVDVNKFSLL